MSLMVETNAVRVMGGPYRVRRVTHGVRTDKGEVTIMPAVNCLRRNRLSLMSETGGRTSYIMLALFMGPVRFYPKRSCRVCPQSRRESAGLYRRHNISFLFVPRITSVCTTGTDILVSRSSLSARLYNTMEPNRFEKMYAIITGLFGTAVTSTTVFNRGSTRRMTVVHQVIHSLGVPIRVIVSPVIHRTSNLTVDSHGAHLGNRRHARTLKLSQTLGTTGATMSGNRGSTTTVGTVLINRVRDRSLHISCTTIISCRALRRVSRVGPDALVTLTTRYNSMQLVSGYVLWKVEELHCTAARVQGQPRSYEQYDNG